MSRPGASKVHAPCSRSIAASCWSSPSSWWLPLALVVGLLLICESEWAERWVEARAVRHPASARCRSRAWTSSSAVPLGIALRTAAHRQPGMGLDAQPRGRHHRLRAVRDRAAVQGPVRHALPRRPGGHRGPRARRRARHLALRRRASARRAASTSRVSSCRTARSPIATSAEAHRARLRRDRKPGREGSARVDRPKARSRARPATGTGKIPVARAHAGPSDPDRRPRRAIGKTDIAIDGTVAPDAERSWTSSSRSRAPTLHHLQAIFGINLPDSPPYRLAGQLTRDGPVWNFKPFEGRWATATCGGTLKYTQGDKGAKEGKGGRKPFLQAEPALEGARPRRPGPADRRAAQDRPGRDRLGRAAPEGRDASRRATRCCRACRSAPSAGPRWMPTCASKRSRCSRPKQLPLDTLSDAPGAQGFRDAPASPLNFGFAGGASRSTITLDATKKPDAWRHGHRRAGPAAREAVPHLEDDAGRDGHALRTRQAFAATASRWASCWPPATARSASRSTAGA